MIEKFLVSADWHLRMDRPACRTCENWMVEQKQDLIYLYNAALKAKCSAVIVIGDIFESPTNPEELITFVLNIISYFRHQGIKTYMQGGNHDESYHNPTLIGKTSLGVLLASGVVEDVCFLPDYFFGTHFQDNPSEDFSSGTRIWLLHHAVYGGKLKAPPGVYWTSQTIKNKVKDTDISLVLMGDIHTPWEELDSERLKMAMIGSLNIQKIDMKDHKPRAVILCVEKTVTTVLKTSISFIPLRKTNDIFRTTSPKREKKNEENISGAMIEFSGKLNEGRELSKTLENYVQKLREAAEKETPEVRGRILNLIGSKNGETI